MNHFYALFSTSARFGLLGLCLLLSSLSVRSQVPVNNLPVSSQARANMPSVTGLSKTNANLPIAGQYIVVYKQTSTLQTRVTAVRSFQQRQQLMRDEATATLAKNGLAGKSVLYVYDTALKGFAVSGLTGAEVNQLRQDDQVDYVVADQPVFMSEYGAPAPLAASCNGPSITLNGVTNYNVGIATFGSTATVSGQVVLVVDDTAPVNDGCSTIQNNVSGKIALIDRGLCEFSVKAYNAQLAGAIGVIIANNVAGPPLSMSNGTNSNLVTIPVMSLDQTDGNALKSTLSGGTVVTAVLSRELPDNSSQCKPWGISRVGGGGSGVGKRAWIIDTGIDLTHPDLNVNTALSTYFIGTSPADDDGHGTHVAGTVAAKNNSFGVIGVAAGAEVVSVKVLAGDNASSGAIVLAGVNYVTAHAGSADVVNMSLGGPINKALDDGVLALSNVCKVVIAAGNNGRNANYQSPGRVNGPNVLTVSAMDIYDKLASFSSFGNGPVDYSAPGVNVASCWLNGGYKYLSGTSMAAPHVSGLLLLGTICGTSKVTGDKDNVPDLIATLYNAANDVDNDHDGYTLCGGDCDDSDPTVHPGAAEICDNKDNNCNGQIDEGNVCCPAGNTGKLYVNASATGTNTGVSWTNAFTSLQSALTAAKRCSQITQIWVAKGTYYPSTDALGQTAPLDPRTKAFIMQNNLAIYGGFAGNEGNLSQRDLSLNITSLSGEIQQDNQIANDAYHVVLNIPAYGTSLNSTAVLDGFIIRDGFATFEEIIGTDTTASYPDSFGGGVINYNASPTIRNCIIFNNGAYYGGGISNYLASPGLPNNFFVVNVAGFGGAVFNESVSSPTFINCAILQNDALYGAGIENDNGSSPALTNCSFSGNNASLAGGGMYNFNGSSPVVKNSIFWGDGTEISNAPSSATIAASNPTITYSIIQGGWSGAGANNLNVNPKFVSQPVNGQNAIGDLSLANCSPAINAGDPTTTTGTVGPYDLDSNPRIFGGRIDIGAFEFQGTSSFSVAISANPSLSITAGSSLTLTASTADSFTWSTGATSASIVAAPTSTTAYSVTATSGTCSALASVTVTVKPVPDLYPLIYVRPSTLYGANNPVTVVVDVAELVGVPSSGTITVRVTKEASLSLSYPTTATAISNQSVQNSVWSLNNSDPTYYILTTSSVVGAGEKLSFGFTGFLRAGSTTGVLGLSAVIAGGSGGEVRSNNNSDADRIDYFQQ